LLPAMLLLLLGRPPPLPPLKLWLPQCLAHALCCTRSFACGRSEVELKAQVAPSRSARRRPGRQPRLGSGLQYGKLHGNCTMVAHPLWHNPLHQVFQKHKAVVIRRHIRKYSSAVIEELPPAGSGGRWTTLAQH